MLSRALILIFISSIPLVGCGPTLQDRRNQEAVDIELNCNARFPLKRGNFNSRAQCLDQAMGVRYSNSADGDLISVYEAKRRMIAGQMDMGSIGIDSGRAQIAQAWSDAISTSQARQAARSNAASNAVIASAVQPAPYVPYIAPVQFTPLQLPRAVTTNCFRSGNITNCTSQ